MDELERNRHKIGLEEIGFRGPASVVAMLLPNICTHHFFHSGSFLRVNVIEP